MRERLNVTKSSDSNMVPMAIMGESADDYGKESADDTEEGSGNC